MNVNVEPSASDRPPTSQQQHQDKDQDMKIKGKLKNNNDVKVNQKEEEANPETIALVPLSTLEVNQAQEAPVPA